MFELKNGRPEDYEIPCKAVEELERWIINHKIHIHGYMLLGGKNILAEKYYASFDKDSLHRIYSITKSYVALAVGLLIKNNLVNIDDKICSYFPEMLPEGGAHPWCEEMTIRDMLKMRTCYPSTTYKAYEGCDWTKSFFVAEPDHISGTVFNYDTSAAHVLGALVEKLTGMELMDYLRAEAFDRLGFSKKAYTIKDPVGVSQGGSGMMCTMRDMAVVAYLVNHYGVIDGEELIPKDFMKDAVSNHTPTDLQPVLDEQCGYGYFIWMPRTRECGKDLGSGDGFVMYGMGGQLAVCFPKYDFCFLTIADTIGNPAGLQVFYDGFYNFIYPYLREREKDNREAFTAEIINDSAGIYWKDIKGNINYIYNPESTQPAHSAGLNAEETEYEFYDNTHGWKKVSFDFASSTVRLYYVDDGADSKVLTLKYGCKEPYSAFSDYTSDKCLCQCEGLFRQGHLIIHCHMVDEELGHVSMDFAWKDDSRLSVRMAATNEPFYKNLKGFGSAQKNIAHYRQKM
jgi:CubicO group peptidase (beta-lactamase class C family)